MKNQKIKTSGKNSPAININNAMAPVNVNLNFDNTQYFPNRKPNPFFKKVFKTKLKLHHLFLIGLSVFPIAGISLWLTCENFKILMLFFYEHKYLTPLIYIFELSFLPPALALPIGIDIWRFDKVLLTEFSYVALDENKNVYFYIEI